MFVVDCFDVLGVKIAATNLQQACQTIEEWIETRKKTYICISPVATIVDCQKNVNYREIINGAGMSTPDGMPLVWIGRMKGNRQIGRTYGPDLMLKFCDISQQKGYKHFFLGGTEESNRLLVSNLLEKFPRLNIVGSFAPPFRETGVMEEWPVLERMNGANPDVLWVGLGSPKQDYWMHDHRDKLNVPVMVGVGAAFDFLAGTKKQAPLWMRKAGLEWLFRLCSEPKRLWKRYLIGNTKFVYWIILDFFRSKK